MAFQAKIAEERDMVILALEGKIMDAASLDELNLGLEEVKRRGKRKIILLFKALRHIDEPGAAALAAFLRWAEKRDYQVKLAEVPPDVMKGLDLQGLNRAYDSLRDEMRSHRENEGIGMGEEEGNNGLGGRLHSGGSKMPLLVIAGGLFVFFILIIVYMTRDSSSGVEELQKRVTLLEERMRQAGEQSKSLSVVQNRLEGLRKDIAEKTKQLELDLGKLRLEVEAVSAKARPSEVTSKYHTVIRGETLFSIGKKYGITVEELRRLNNLKSNQSIGVGQKLVVGSGSS